MAQRLIKVFHVFTVLLLVSCDWASEGEAPISVDWRSWSPAVFEQASREGRLVLLDLTAEWCRLCKKMDKTTYRDPQVIAVINRTYIPVRADEKDNPELGMRYQEFGRPATVIFDSNGAEVYKKRGYVQPQWMVWMLEAVAQNPTAEAHQN